MNKDEKVSIPVKPSKALLSSMALRHRHDFGLLPETHQEVILGEMAQLHEEVVGKGFYKYPVENWEIPVVGE